MTHLYTRGSEYALRALQAMTEEPESIWTVPEICEVAETPEQYTRKVLSQLARAGILDSSRGPAGGFWFARDPGDVRLSDVVEAIDSGPRFDLCILGFQQCNEADPCALHDLWSPIKDSALDMLQSKTLLDLGSEAQETRRKAATRRSRRRR